MKKSKYRLNLETIRRLVRKDAGSNLNKLLVRLHTMDIANMLNELSPSEMNTVFSCLNSAEIKAEVISGMESDKVAQILDHLPIDQVRSIMSEMAPDDVASLLKGLTDDRARELQDTMTDQELDKVELLLTYPEETAGRIMTQDVFALESDLTVREALERLRSASRAETVFYAYVINDHRKLLGVVSLRQLILESADKKLNTIMLSNVISVTPLIDQEEVAQIVARYDLLAVPVVDDTGYLLGIITVDDVIDIIHEEAREDIYRLAGSNLSEHDMKSSFKMAGVRTKWLSLRFLGALFCGCLIFSLFHFLNFASLDALMLSLFPVFISIMSGIGTQSSTIVAEQLALRSDLTTNFWNLVSTELRIGLIEGVLFGSLMVALTGTLGLVAWHSAGVLGAILAVGIVSAVLLGTFTPYIALKIGRDPALVTGSMISSVLDFTSVVFYLSALLILMKVP